MSRHYATMPISKIGIGSKTGSFIGRGLGEYRGGDSSIQRRSAKPSPLWGKNKEPVREKMRGWSGELTAAPCPYEGEKWVGVSGKGGWRGSNGGRKPSFMRKFHLRSRSRSEGRCQWDIRVERLKRSNIRGKYGAFGGLSLCK